MWSRTARALLAVVVTASVAVAGIGTEPAKAAGNGASGGLLLQLCLSPAFGFEGDDCELSAVDASNLASHPLGTPPVSPHEMRRSPVSNIVAAVGYSGGGGKVVVFDQAGTILRSVAASPGATLEDAIAWDPTGSFVVYAERDGSTASLIALDVSTGATASLGSWPSTTSAAAVHSIDWSPDGTTIALSGGHDAGTPTGLWTLDVATGVATQHTTALVGMVRYSPGGGHLAYAACLNPGSDAVHELRVQDAAFAAPATVLQSFDGTYDAECLSRDSELAWHPDGDRLATRYVDVDDPDYPQQLRVLDLAGTVVSERDLIATFSRVVGLAWAPDGKGLAFVSESTFPFFAYSFEVHLLSEDLSSETVLETIELGTPIPPVPMTDIVWAMPAHLPPHASPEAYRVNPNQALSVTAPGVLANDATYGTPATTMLLSGPAGLALGTDGSLAYTAPGVEGPQPFEYEMGTSGGTSETQSQILVDQAPALDMTVFHCPGGVSGPPYDDTCDVTVADLAAATSTPLFTGPAFGTWWNPSHTRIITGDPDEQAPDPESETTDVVVRDAAMAELWRIEGTQGYVHDPWSADGQRIAYTEWIGTNFEVHTVGADGTGDELVATVPREPSPPTIEVRWASSGHDRMIVSTGTEVQVYDGSTLVASVPVSDTSVVAHPTDPDVVAYTEHIQSGSEHTLQLRRYDIADGTDTLISDLGDAYIDFPLTWSPDGSTIALSRAVYGTDQSGIWLVDVMSGALSPFHPAETGQYGLPTRGIYRLDFSPDGSGIAWAEVEFLNHANDTRASLLFKELDSALPLVLVDSVPGFAGFDWGGPAAPGTSDHFTLTVSGSKSYSADTDLTTGNLRVVKDRFGVASVSGSGTFPGVHAPTASVSVALNRFWILPLWLGNVRVDDGSTHLDAFMLFPSVSPTSDGAVVNGGWLQFSGFPWNSGSLNLRVRDLG